MSKPDKKAPAGSELAKLYLCEQIFAQATNEKMPANSIDLHGRIQKGALKALHERFNDIENCLTSGDINHNCGDGKNHLFKVICGRGGSKGSAKLKYAVSEWLQETKRDHIGTVEDGVFFVNFN